MTYAVTLLGSFYFRYQEFVNMNMSDEETLISLIRNHRLLIDKTNKYCNDSPMRNGKWEEIE
jgi:uncharacterized membrane protein YobD (UPF0266 family)